MNYNLEAFLFLVSKSMDILIESLSNHTETSKMVKGDIQENY